MELRDSRYVVHEGCDHIFFVGFLGAGKSTLARNLGELFHRRYVDTDRLAERIAGKSLAEIYEDDGEELFRQAETEVLQTLKSKKSLLVSCGGGIVEKDINLALMREMGVIVFLDGDLSDSLRQIQRTDRRPDLGSVENATQLYRRLRPRYEVAADITIDIREKTFEQVAIDSGKLLWERGLL